jgi:hypothetical protein
MVSKRVQESEPLLGKDAGDGSLVADQWISGEGNADD